MLVASAGRGFGAVIPEVGGAKPEETSRRGVCTVMSSLSLELSWAWLNVRAEGHRIYTVKAFNNMQSGWDK